MLTTAYSLSICDEWVRVLQKFNAKFTNIVARIGNLSQNKQYLEKLAW